MFTGLSDGNRNAVKWGKKKKAGKVLVMLLVNTTTERYVSRHGKSRL